MISEITFSKKFTSFWNETLPNANNYIRLINGGQVQATHKPLKPAPRKQNIALINVLAFEIYKRLTAQKSAYTIVSAPSFFSGKLFASCMKSAKEYVGRFGTHQMYKLPLSLAEQAQLKEIVRITNVRYNWKLGPTVDPKFEGCGFIDQCFGDIVVGQRLVEIKSGERSFGVSDLRQLLVYCTLNHYSKNPVEIDSIEIFNPRMGACFSEELETVSLHLSALSSRELFSEIQKYISDEPFIEIVEG